MKYLIPVLCAAALLAGCAKKKDPEVEVPPAVVDWDQLDKGGLHKFEGKPFTGVAVSKWSKEWWHFWHENGQKEYESTYKDGKLHGLATEWHKNGQKRAEGTFKDGQEHGLWTRWYENGQKEEEITYKDGHRYSRIIPPKFFDKAGNQIVCGYHENGQKRWEGTYKDGKLISKKKWDENGNPE